MMQPRVLRISNRSQPLKGGRASANRPPGPPTEIDITERIIEARFREGTPVEISFREGHFCGAWFPGYIIKKIRYGVFMVKYHYLSFSDEAGHIRKFNDIRPSLPLNFERRKFYVSEEVDAFYYHGWWRGTITKVLSSHRYIVFCKKSQELKIFKQFELRPHMEWINGEWFQDSHERMESKLTEGASVEIRFHEGYSCGAWFPGTIIKEICNDFFVAKYHFLRLNDEAGHIRVFRDIRPSPPINSERRKKFYVSEEVDALYHHGWWSGIITEVLSSSRYIVFCKHLEELKMFNRFELRPHLEWVNGEWVEDFQETSVIAPNQAGLGSPIPSRNTDSSTEMAIEPNGKVQNSLKNNSPPSSDNLYEMMETPSLAEKDLLSRKAEITFITSETSDIRQFKENLKEGEAENASMSMKACEPRGTSIRRSTSMEEHHDLMRSVSEGEAQKSHHNRRETPIVQENFAVSFINKYSNDEDMFASSSGERRKEDLDTEMCANYQSRKLSHDNVIDGGHSEVIVFSITETKCQKKQPLAPSPLLITKPIGDLKTSVITQNQAGLGSPIPTTTDLRMEMATKPSQEVQDNLNTEPPSSSSNMYRKMEKPPLVEKDLSSRKRSEMISTPVASVILQSHDNSKEGDTECGPVPKKACGLRGTCIRSCNIMEEQHDLIRPLTEGEEKKSNHKGSATPGLQEISAASCIKEHHQGDELFANFSKRAGKDDAGREMCVNYRSNRSRSDNVSEVEHSTVAGFINNEVKWQKKQPLARLPQLMKKPIGDMETTEIARNQARVGSPIPTRNSDLSTEVAIKPSQEVHVNYGKESPASTNLLGKMGKPPGTKKKVVIRKKVLKKVVIRRKKIKLIIPDNSVILESAKQLKEGEPENGPLPMKACVVRGTSIGSSNTMNEQHDLIRPVTEGEGQSSNNKGSETPILQESSAVSFIKEYSKDNMMFANLSEVKRREDLEADICVKYRSDRSRSSNVAEVEHSEVGFSKTETKLQEKQPLPQVPLPVKKPFSDMETSEIERNQARIESSAPTRNLDLSSEMVIKPSQEVHVNFGKESPSSTNLLRKMGKPTLTKKKVVIRKKKIKLITSDTSVILQSDKKLKEGVPENGPMPMRGTSIGSSNSMEEQHDLIKSVTEGKGQKSIHKGSETPILQESSAASFIEECEKGDDVFACYNEEKEPGRPKALTYCSKYEGVLEFEHADVIGLPKIEVKLQKKQPLVRLPLLMRKPLDDMVIKMRGIEEREKRQKKLTDSIRQTAAKGMKHMKSGLGRPKALSLSTHLLTAGVSTEDKFMQDETVVERDVSMLRHGSQNSLALIEYLNNLALPGNDGSMVRPGQNSLAMVESLNNLEVPTVFKEYHSTRSGEQTETALQSPTAFTTGTFCQEIAIPESPFHRDEDPAPPSFPCVKHPRLLPLWECVDSMSVFKSVPQQPHLHPLEQYNEKLREGMSLGCMATLADVVEETRIEPFDEPKSSLDKNLVALSELEELGFTVHPIQSWLQELLDIKGNCKQIEDNSKTVEKKLFKERYKKRALDAIGEEIQKNINEKKRKLETVMMEKETKRCKLVEF